MALLSNTSKTPIGVQPTKTGLPDLDVADKAPTEEYTSEEPDQRAAPGIDRSTGRGDRSGRDRSGRDTGENFEGSLPGPSGTPTTSPVTPGEDFTPQPVLPGDLPTMPAPGEGLPAPGGVDLDEFTPDPDDFDLSPNQDTRTGRTDQDAADANKQDKSATEDVKNEVIEADVEAKETGASSAPWYDPFRWFTSSEGGGSGGAGGSLPVGPLALGAAAIAVYFASTQ